MVTKKTIICDRCEHELRDNTGKIMRCGNFEFVHQTQVSAAVGKAYDLCDDCYSVLVKKFMTHGSDN